MHYVEHNTSDGISEYSKKPGTLININKPNSYPASMILKIITYLREHNSVDCVFSLGSGSWGRLINKVWTNFRKMF